jgi:uncharacterized protein DUF6220
VRATYRILAMSIAIGVVLQAAFIAAAWFSVLHDTDSGAVYDKNTDYNWGQSAHQILGMMIMPLLALLLLLVSFFARIPGGVQWAGITVALVVLQIVLAYAGFGAPIVGTLHGLNAFALAGVASVAMRKARLAGTAAPAQPAAV